MKMLAQVFDIVSSFMTKYKSNANFQSLNLSTNQWQYAWGFPWLPGPPQDAQEPSESWKSFETLENMEQTLKACISTPRASTEMCQYILEMPAQWQSIQTSPKVPLPLIAS